MQNLQKMPRDNLSSSRRIADFEFRHLRRWFLQNIAWNKLLKWWKWFLIKVTYSPGYPPTWIILLPCRSDRCPYRGCIRLPALDHWPSYLAAKSMYDPSPYPPELRQNIRRFILIEWNRIKYNGLKQRLNQFDIPKMYRTFFTVTVEKP